MSRGESRIWTSAPAASPYEHASRTNCCRSNCIWIGPGLSSRLRASIPYVLRKGRNVRGGKGGFSNSELVKIVGPNLDESSQTPASIRRSAWRVSFHPLKCPTTLTATAFGAHTAKRVPATLSITIGCAPKKDWAWWCFLVQIDAVKRLDAGLERVGLELGELLPYASVHVT